MLWLRSQSLRRSPSSLLGLTEGSYEAYCLDEAIWYFGSTIQHELEKAGQKRQKGEAKMEAARKRVLAKRLGEENVPQQYADPALLMMQVTGE